MSLYVYQTKECEDDAKRHSLHKEVASLETKVELLQTIDYFDNFPPPYLKKRFRRQERLLAENRTILVEDEQHVVVCFLRILERNGGVYKKFLDDPTKYGKNKLSCLVSDKELELFLKARLKEKPIPPKKDLSETENHFLYRLLGSDTNRWEEDLVFESKEWVKKISKDKKVQGRLGSFFDVLAGLAGDDETTREIPVNKYTIVFRRFPTLKKLFLAGIAGDDEEKIDLWKKYEEILTLPSEKEVKDQILQNSERMYSAFMLAEDEDIWLDIESKAEANLALSPEETDVLESVHADSGGGYPVFINGRAGSGKSTILYYLFTDYVSLYLELKDDDPELKPPILLSSGSHLKKQAKKSVNNLLRCKQKYIETLGKKITSPEECFADFHEFLLSLIPHTDRLKQFPKQNYINFGTFRNKWEEQFKHDRNSLKQTGPDLSWHIIRSYIKGMNPEDYLDPESYKDLPKKQRSVTEGSYDLVYERVWENWYTNLCHNEGFWDDQDLARYVFCNNLAKPLRSAVFCDESQDFTRVELDVIFRLNLFVDRKVPFDALNRIPFAFAGDPFQTLNPTGFRWDAVKTLFHDKLVDSLGENNENRLIDLNYQDLELNYRSTKNIVRLCNLIQAIRAKLFDLPDLKPQSTWQSELNSPFPVWFDRNQKNKWQRLEKEKDITIIVPCNQDEEHEFILKNEDLKEVVEMDEAGVPRNVLSPARAKGLEFKRVVLFGFADNMPGNISELLKLDTVVSDSLLTWEYYINRLYVAASRPKRRLFIIDKQESYNQLWAIANDDTLKEEVFSTFSEWQPQWASNVGGIQKGIVSNWNDEKGEPLVIAENLYKQGLATQDPFMLRSAAQYFESLGKSTDAIMSKAYALELEEKFTNAGELFAEAGAPNNALDCYWEAGLEGANGINELGEKFAEIQIEREYKLIYHYIRKDPDGIIQSLQELRKDCNNQSNLRNQVITERTFSSILGAYAKTMLENKKLSKTHAKRMAPLLAYFSEIGLDLKPDLLAQFNYKAGDLEKAIELWEKAGKPNSENYKEAKKQVLIQKADTLSPLQVGKEDGRTLAAYYLEKGNLPMALRYYDAHGKTADLFEVVSQIPESYQDSQNLLLKFFEILGRKANYDLIIDLAEGRVKAKRKGSPEERWRQVLDWHHDEIRNAVVIVSANSDELPSVKADLSTKYSNYFKKELYPFSKWKNVLALEVVGAAMERAGIWKDVLPFYAHVINGEMFNKKDKEFAKIRWIKSKEKQISREERKTKNMSKELLDKYRREYIAKKKALQMKDQKFPEYPLCKKRWADVPPVTSPDPLEKNPPVPEGGQVIPSHSSKESTRAPSIDKQSIIPTIAPEMQFEVVNFGPLEFKFWGLSGRMNITDTKTGIVAVFSPEKKKLDSTDLEIDHSNGVFRCKKWGLILEHSLNKDDSFLKVTFDKGHVSLVFDTKSEKV